MPSRGVSCTFGNSTFNFCNIFFLILRTAHIVFHNVSVVLIGFLIGTICTLDVDKRLLVNVSINLGYSVDYV